MRSELASVAAQATRPFNVNFSCYTPPAPDAAREAAWRAGLAPYFAEYGIDPATVPRGAARTPFGDDAADVLAEFRPRRDLVP
jgi:nitronate monooxygenase